MPTQVGLAGLLGSGCCTKMPCGTLTYLDAPSDSGQASLDGCIAREAAPCGASVGLRAVGPSSLSLVVSWVLQRPVCSGAPCHCHCCTQQRHWTPTRCLWYSDRCVLAPNLLVALLLVLPLQVWLVMICSSRSARLRRGRCASGSFSALGPVNGIPLALACTPCSAPCGALFVHACCPQHKPSILCSSSLGPLV